MILDHETFSKWKKSSGFFYQGHKDRDLIEAVEILTKALQYYAEGDYFGDDYVDRQYGIHAKVTLERVWRKD